MNELPIKDIHLPDVSLWWPLAPGWWLLLLVVILMIYGLYQGFRWLKYKPVRSLALTELKDLQKQLEAGENQPRILAALSTLIRRTVMSYSGRESSASLSGDAWIKHLKNMPGAHNFSDAELEILAYLQYRAAPDCDLERLLSSCENWFKSLPRKVSHVSV